MPNAAPSATALPARAIALWERACARRNPAPIVVAAWAVLALPLVFFRGYNGDEGLAVTIARSALEQGDWLTPHVFNLRFVERPTLLSWIIGFVSLPFGSVTQLSARLTVAAFLLAGCLLIDHLLRRSGASAGARVLGALLFLACPLVQRGYVAITADMPLAVLLFAAFVLWWTGRPRPTVPRWLAIGTALALAGLMKGPQPVAYFAIGVGAFLLWRREWRQLPGYLLAGAVAAAVVFGWYGLVFASGDEAQWAAFMRLKGGAPLPGPLHTLPQVIGETVPAVLAAAAWFAVRSPPEKDRSRRDLVLALALYAVPTSIVVLFWPGGSTARYYFPAVPALAAIGGLAYDRFKAARPEALAPALAAMAGVLAYCFAYSAVSPFLPAQFRSAKLDAERIERAMQGRPAPLYRTNAVGLNVIPYIPGPIVQAAPSTLAAVPGPAWLAVTPEEAAALTRSAPERVHAVLSFGTDQEWRLLRVDG